MTDIDPGILTQHLNDLARRVREDLGLVDLRKVFRVTMSPETFAAVRKLPEPKHITIVQTRFHGIPVDVDPDMEPGAIRLSYSVEVGP
jgi:hypothetical protein